MAKAHYLVPTGITSDPMTVRLGASGDAAGNLTTKDQSKLVKQVGESQYDICAVGDLIEGQILSVNVQTENGWSIGGVVDKDMIYATADGSQAAGAGNLAVGDYVVAGTQPVKGTKLVNGEYPRVRKATLQLGAAPATLAEAGTMAKYATRAWKVVSLYRSGTGAPGTIIVIKPMY